MNAGMPEAAEACTKLLMRSWDGCRPFSCRLTWSTFHLSSTDSFENLWKTKTPTRCGRPISPGPRSGFFRGSPPVDIRRRGARCARQASLTLGPDAPVRPRTIMISSESRIETQFASAIGPDNVTADPNIVVDGLRPGLLLRPASKQEVVECLKICA